MGQTLLDGTDWHIFTLELWLLLWPLGFWLWMQKMFWEEEKDSKGHEKACKGSTAMEEFLPLEIAFGNKEPSIPCRRALFVPLPLGLEFHPWCKDGCSGLKLHSAFAAALGCGCSFFLFSFAGELGALVNHMCAWKPVSRWNVRLRLRQSTFSRLALIIKMRWAVYTIWLESRRKNES